VDKHLVSWFAESMRAQRQRAAQSVKEALDAIEKAWRDAGHRTLRGLVFKGPNEKGIIPESTWFSWRKGNTTPDYEEIQRVAKAVSLDVRPLRQGSDINHDGGLNLTDAMRQMLGIMQSLPERDQEQVLRLALGYAKMFGGAPLSDPPGADAVK
jgi:hypothetical protein